MDVEEFKTAMATDEGKAIIDALVTEAVDATNNKNRELLGKLDKAKTERNDFSQKVDAMEDDISVKAGDYDKLRERLEERHVTEINKVSAERDTLRGQLDTHVIGTGLTQALLKANIAPPLMDAAKALIRSSYKAEIGDNDGKPFAKLDGQAVNDFVDKWSQSESGKHFVVADSNGGGGSNGANGSGQAISEMTSVQKIASGLAKTMK